MSDDQRPIIVKKIKKGGAAAHGGAWKIAYADFVTAMMAFFLLMWLLGSTSQGDLKGIADHFSSPLKVSLSGGSGAGDASTVIQGGGPDLTKVVGQVKAGQSEGNKKFDDEEARRRLEAAERKQLDRLKGEIESLIEARPDLRQFKDQLLIDMTDEGLRVQIVDEKNRPMFESGSSELKGYTQVILQEIGRVLNEVENRISVTGHTDATPYAGGSRAFSNWELSANRANSARRELLAGGMADHKIMRVVGLASTVLFDRFDPLNPINRRISILVMNRKAVENMLRDGAEVPADDAVALSRSDS